MVVFFEYKVVALQMRLLIIPKFPDLRQGDARIVVVHVLIVA